MCVKTCGQVFKIHVGTAKLFKVSGVPYRGPHDVKLKFGAHVFSAWTRARSSKHCHSVEFIAATVSLSASIQKNKAWLFLSATSGI